MKKRGFNVLAVCFGLLLLLLFTPLAAAAEVPAEIPVKGMVTMIDLGAKTCVPCKLMAPILEKLGKVYAGRAAIVFVDVREDQKAAQRFGVRAIPTQIFFDKVGREVFRHVGFMSEEAIILQLKYLGVK